MSAYRVPGAVLADGPEALAKGPARRCKGCGAEALDAVTGGFRALPNDDRPVVGRHEDSPLPMPRACTAARRVRVGWFGRCEGRGEHLHERCRLCGLQWLTAFVGDA